jgi:hypothetical protein
MKRERYFRPAETKRDFIRRLLNLLERGSARAFEILTACFLATFFVHASYACATSRPPEDVSSLVARITDAYGGKRVIDGLTSVSAVGYIDAFARNDHGTYELQFRRPRKLRVQTKYERSAETRILNGDQGYRGKDTSPLSQAQDYSLLAMVYQYKHFDLPYGLSSGAYLISRKGKEVLNGKPVEVLHLTDSEGPPMDAYIDAETYYIVKVTGYFKVAYVRSTALSSEFSDFRKVGETVFPYRITSYAGGQKIAETIMKIYRINLPIPDTLFSP